MAIRMISYTSCSKVDTVMGKTGLGSQNRVRFKSAVQLELARDRPSKSPKIWSDFIALKISLVNLRKQSTHKI